MNKVKILTIIVILSVIIFYLEISSFFSIGHVINIYFPCEQHPMNSSPCYMIYDIIIMELAAIVAVSIVVLSIKRWIQRLYF